MCTAEAEFIRILQLLIIGTGGTFTLEGFKAAFKGFFYPEFRFKPCLPFKIKTDDLFSPRKFRTSF
jgi:hypothetical protein